MSSLDYLDLCRLCLVKDRVSVPIFEGEGDVRQIFLKITACLPVKVAREDKLPKKICDDCVYKVELIYQFWHTTANAEKQLLQWLGEVNMEDKQGYVGTVLNPNGMKPEQSNENRLDGTVMQQVSEHQNNMTMGMMDNMGLTMPMMMSSSTQQQITSVPIDNSGSSVQNVQPVAGPSTQTSHDQITQDQTNASTQQEEEEESSEEEENSDDECDGDEGLPIKEESEEDPNRTIEPTTFVNVSLACDEAGPSGLQQQKIADMPEMVMSQTSDVDPKTGGRWTTVWDGEKYRKVIVPYNAVVLEPTYKKNVKKRDGSTKRRTQNKRRQRTKENNKKRKPSTTIEVNQNVSDKEKIKSITEILFSEDIAKKEKKEDVDRILDEMRNACPLCLKRFDHEKHLRRHIVVSHPKRAYKCDKCRASYYTKQNLEKHCKSHSDDYFFECDVCHLKYKRKITLKHHQVRAHSDIATQFICDSCGQSFKVKVDLLVHINRKHNTNIHICRYCGKSVTDLSHEWKHKKRAEMASLKFSCHLCIRKFQNQTRLDNHLLLHKQGYKCTECNVIVTSSTQLKYHKDRMHKPGTTCPICKKMFVSSGNNFYQHVLTHAGIRPYNCDICGEDFTQRSSLFRHRKNHPGPLPSYTSQIPIAALARNVLRKLLKQ